MSAKIHELFGICATVDPVDGNNVDSDTDEIDMSKWKEVLFIYQFGVIAASATCAITIKSATAAGGSFSTVTGKTQNIVATDDNFQFLIRVGAEELTPGHRYVKGTMDNSAHSQLMACVVIGIPNYGPATDHDLSSVQTVVD